MPTVVALVLWLLLAALRATGMHIMRTTGGLVATSHELTLCLK